MYRLRQQQITQHSSATEIAAMQQEMQGLQQRVTDSEQAKLLLQSEIDQVKSQDNQLSMQDSVVGGDSLIGSTKIETQTINDPEAIARAAILAYRMAKEEKE